MTKKPSSAETKVLTVRNYDNPLCNSNVTVY